MRPRRLLVMALKLILGLCVSLIILEIGVRVVAPQKRISVCMTTWDADVGTKNIAGARGFARNSEYSMDMAISSQGLRDREFTYDKPAKVKRILCLGDSYTFGYGVQAEQTFAKRLEARLAERDGRDAAAAGWEVINAGVGSTGTAHQLAYFTTEGHKYQPDIVVLCFCPANDFWENITSGLYSLEDDRLVKHEAPLTEGRKIQRLTRFVPGYNSFFARSHLLNLLRYRFSAMHYRDVARRDSSAAKTEAVLARRDRLTRRLLLALRDTCERYGCRLAVMIIPPPSVTNLPERTRHLIDFARAEGIDCLDLQPILSAEERRGIRLSYPKDGHWNATGHQLVADALYDHLSDRGMH